MARQIQLPSGQMVLVEDVDYDELSRYSWWLTSNGYAARNVYGKVRSTIRMHRQILGLAVGDKRIVDHINGDQLDNRRSNLRICNISQNVMNSKTRSDSLSGLKGVTVSPNGFRAQISVDGKPRSLGTYKTAKEAHEVYCLWASMVYGEFFNPGYRPVAQ